MNLILLANIITCVCAFIGFAYGIAKFFKPKKAVYPQMITLAVGCMTFGRLYQTVRLCTGGDIMTEFQLGVLDLNSSQFCFLTDNGNLTELFNNNNLQDGKLTDYDTERAVIVPKNENNKYLNLFYRVRDGFAHGKFILKYSSDHEKMIIIQDNDSNSVTARIILKLSTLMTFIEAIDIKGLIEQHINTIKHAA